MTDFDPLPPGFEDFGFEAEPEPDSAPPHRDTDRDRIDRITRYIDEAENGPVIDDFDDDGSEMEMETEDGYAQADDASEGLLNASEENDLHLATHGALEEFYRDAHEAADRYGISLSPDDVTELFFHLRDTGQWNQEGVSETLARQAHDEDMEITRRARTGRDERGEPLLTWQVKEARNEMFARRVKELEDN